MIDSGMPFRILDIRKLIEEWGMLKNKLNTIDDELKSRCLNMMKAEKPLTVEGIGNLLSVKRGLALKLVKVLRKQGIIESASNTHGVARYHLTDVHTERKEKVYSLVLNGTCETAAEVSMTIDIDKKTATNILKALYQEGKLSRENVNRKWAYSKPESKLPWGHNENAIFINKALREVRARY